MKNNNKSAFQRQPQKNRFLLIFVCIFISAVLVFGIVLGIVSGAKKSKTVASLNGVGMNYEVISYFASQYKYNFMNMLSASGHKNVEDSPGFWNKDSGDGKTYGELLNEGVKEYIAQILVTNYLYDRYTKLSASDKALISTAVEETLTYKANGNEDEFNKAVKEFGFSYSSYKDAAAMVYKTLLAQRVICGENGKNLEDEYEIISEYLSEYTHVKLLFIRTETTFVLDAEGNRVVENDGTYATRELTESEKLERQELISEIRGYIENAMNEENNAMGAEMFDQYLKNNDEGDRKSHDYGYYFHKSSDFSKVFAEEFEDVVNTAYEMKVGDFGEAEVDFGVCFIYKYDVSYNDIENSALKDCFADFYSELSDVFFAEQVKELSKDVKFNKKFDEIDMILLPYNYGYHPVF